MNHSQIVILSIVLVFLVILAAFFSCAETGLMAINRYRLRHRARMQKSSAILILKLLKRPDRLLGMILIGNNLANIIASAITTLIALHYWGDKGVIIATFILTLVILIFAEVAPKTIAALYPENISRFVAWPVYFLLKIFYPFVWLINGVSNGLLRLLGFKVSSKAAEPLTREELRSVVYETSGRISHPYQDMLLGILDLNKVTVNEVMIPRHDIIGIDIDSNWETILEELSKSQFDWLPVYRENINQVLGVLHLRDVMHALIGVDRLNKDLLLKHVQEAYFVPEGTPLNIQLINFQHLKKRLALVVDEYGEIQGLLTLADIFEEIVGEFTTTVEGVTKAHLQSDGSYLVEGSMTVREFNRVSGWQLPTRSSRTLNGLIVEYLEAIPRPGIAVRINDYPIEIVRVKENRVKTARIFSKLNT